MPLVILLEELPQLLVPRISHLHLDFELSSTLDLRKVGLDAWIKHPSTRVILVGFAIDDDPAQSYVWEEKGFPLYKYELARALTFGPQVHAWNAPFERLVWNTHIVKGGLPPIPHEQWVCTMATAANAGLPMALDAAASALSTAHVKDKQGHALMLRMARPRSLDPDGTPHWWDLESAPKLLDLQAYNTADVETERDIHRRVPRMTHRERQIWLTDQRMNDRGLPVDKPLLNRLEIITNQELERIDREIERLTEGEVLRSTQHARLLKWVRRGGGASADVLPDLRKDTLAGFIGSPEFYDTDCYTQEVLTLRAEAAKTSTAKLKSIREYAQRDGYARHLVQYAGAVRTLRWAGRGVQIQNFPRPVVKHTKDAIEAILDGFPAEGLRAIFGNPLDVVSSCLRGVFKAPQGYKFVVCDYHAIEAIVLAWLADFKDLLDVFRNGEDVYIFTAHGVGSTDRTLGKVLRLACGYGMGGEKFRASAAKYRLELSFDEASGAVKAFRAANRPIVSLWYAYESAAKKAIDYPDQQFTVGKVKFRMARKDGRVSGALLIEKPSGGTLVYRDAALVDERVNYMGVHQVTRQWTQLDTYGGKLCLAGDTLVLTEKGWLRLDKLAHERVWDGHEWVAHGGVVCNGVRVTISLDGVRMTPDHEVLTVEGWIGASSCEGLDRAPVALPDSASLCGGQWQEVNVDRSLRLRGREADGCERDPQGEGKVVRVPSWNADFAGTANARHEQAPSVSGVARVARPVSAPHASGLAELWGERDHGLPGMERGLRGVLAGHGVNISTRLGHRESGQRCRIFGGELRLGYSQGEREQPPIERLHGHPLGPNDGHPGIREERYRPHHAALSDRAWREPVYDVLDAGPHHRFVVAGLTGPLIVSNCENVTQAVARDLLADAMLEYDALHPDTLVTTVHDELVALVPEVTWQVALADMKRIMSTPPGWATGMPLSAAGYSADRYSKA